MKSSGAVTPRAIMVFVFNQLTMLIFIAAAFVISNKSERAEISEPLFVNMLYMICAAPVLLSAFIALRQIKPPPTGKTLETSQRFMLKTILAVTLCESALIIGFLCVLSQRISFGEFLPIAGSVFMINFMVILPSILSAGREIDAQI